MQNEPKKEERDPAQAHNDWMRACLGRVDTMSTGDRSGFLDQVASYMKENSGYVPPEDISVGLNSLAQRDIFYRKGEDK